MYEKVGLLLLLAVLGVCSIQAADDVSPYGHWDDFAAKIEELQDLVNRAQDVTFSQSNQLSIALFNFTTSKTDEAQNSIQAGLTILRKQLGDLLVLADALGTPECLNAREKELDIVAEDLRLNIENCIRYLEVEARSIITNTSATVYWAQGQVTDLRVKMEQSCQDPSENDEDVQCILNLIGEVETARDVLPMAMLDEILRVTLSMKTYELDITECGDHRAGLIYTEGNRIVFEVERCIIASK